MTVKAEHWIKVNGLWYAAGQEYEIPSEDVVGEPSATADEKTTFVPEETSVENATEQNHAEKKTTRGRKKSS